MTRGVRSLQEVTFAMALRLTTASAPKTVRRSPQELAALARTHLGQGDVAAYRALFEQVAGDPNAHSRFRGSLTLLEAAMGTSGASTKILYRTLLAGARAGL